MSDSPRPPGSVLSYYESFDEQARLSSAWGQVELLRTQEILKRHLPPAPARVLDVGGAAGRYSLWLARQGYEAHLVDPVPRLVEQAREAVFEILRRLEAEPSLLGASPHLLCISRRPA